MENAPGSGGLKEQDTPVVKKSGGVEPTGEYDKGKDMDVNAKGASLAGKDAAANILVSEEKEDDAPGENQDVRPSDGEINIKNEGLLAKDKLGIEQKHNGGATQDASANKQKAEEEHKPEQQTEQKHDDKTLKGAPGNKQEAKEEHVPKQEIKQKHDDKPIQDAPGNKQKVQEEHISEDEIEQKQEDMLVETQALSAKNRLGTEQPPYEKLEATSYKQKTDNEEDKLPIASQESSVNNKLETEQKEDSTPIEKPGMSANKQETENKTIENQGKSAAIENPTQQTNLDSDLSAEMLKNIETINKQDPSTNEQPSKISNIGQDTHTESIASDLSANKQGSEQSQSGRSAMKQDIENTSAAEKSKSIQDAGRVVKEQQGESLPDVSTKQQEIGVEKLKIEDNERTMSVHQTENGADKSLNQEGNNLTRETVKKNKTGIETGSRSAKYEAVGEDSYVKVKNGMEVLLKLRPARKRRRGSSTRGKTRKEPESEASLDAHFIETEMAAGNAVEAIRVLRNLNLVPRFLAKTMPPRETPINDTHRCCRLLKVSKGEKEEEPFSNIGGGDESFANPEDDNAGGESSPSPEDNHMRDMTPKEPEEGKMGGVAVKTAEEGKIGDAMLTKPAEGNIGDEAFPNPAEGNMGDEAFPDQEIDNLGDQSFAPPQENANLLQKQNGSDTSPGNGQEDSREEDSRTGANNKKAKTNPVLDQQALESLIRDLDSMKTQAKSITDGRDHVMERVQKRAERVQVARDRLKKAIRKVILMNQLGAEERKRKVEAEKLKKAQEVEALRLARRLEKAKRRKERKEKEEEEQDARKGKVKLFNLSRKAVKIKREEMKRQEEIERQADARKRKTAGLFEAIQQLKTKMEKTATVEEQVDELEGCFDEQGAPKSMVYLHDGAVGMWKDSKNGFSSALPPHLARKLEHRELALKNKWLEKLEK